MEWKEEEVHLGRGGRWRGWRAEGVEGAGGGITEETEWHGSIAGGEGELGDSEARAPHDTPPGWGH